MNIVLEFIMLPDVTLFIFPQLDEELSGVVEVLGMVSNKGTIMASAYNILREDKGIPFGKYIISPVEKGMCSQS